MHALTCTVSAELGLMLVEDSSPHAGFASDV
jgi:hypothetical protein